MRKLSKNEKLVLYSLIKYPSLSSNKIREKIGMKVSTFSSIKMRLERSGYYSTVYVPMFPCIGCELFIVSYGLLNRATTVETRLAIANQLFEEFAEFFYIISESNQAINLAVSRNYTDYDRDVERFTQIYMEHDFLTEKGFTYIIFPFEISTIFNFFNYAPFLSRYFTLGFEENWKTDEICACNICGHREAGTANMTKTEKNTYYGFVKYPQLSNKALAERISASRNTIAKLKRRFFDEKLIIPRRVPNLNLLGLKLLVFTHVTFNPKITVSERKKVIENAQEILTPILFISKNIEGILLTPCIDFEDCQRRLGMFFSSYIENGYINEEPTNLLLSIPQMMLIKNHVYAPLTKKVLGI